MRPDHGRPNAGRKWSSPLSSRGLGRRPLTAETRVRIPVAVLTKALLKPGLFLFSWSIRGPIPRTRAHEWSELAPIPDGLLAERTPLSPAHLDSDRIRGFKGAFAGRSAVEIELHRIGDLDPVTVAGQ